MDNKDLLKFCRYYQGESLSPEDSTALFWEYEKKWIELLLTDSPLLEGMVSIYISNGLKDFRQGDNIPVTLKALLFNRYSHWLKEDADGFKKWYLEYYY